MNGWTKLAPKQRIRAAVVIAVLALAIFATLYTRQRMNAAAIARFQAQPVKNTQTNPCAKGYYAPLVDGRVQTTWCKEITKATRP